MWPFKKKPLYDTRQAFKPFPEPTEQEYARTLPTTEEQRKEPKIQVSDLPERVENTLQVLNRLLVNAEDELEDLINTYLTNKMQLERKIADIQEGIEAWEAAHKVYVSKMIDAQTLSPPVEEEETIEQVLIDGGVNVDKVIDNLMKDLPEAAVFPDEPPQEKEMIVPLPKGSKTRVKK